MKSTGLQPENVNENENVVEHADDPDDDDDDDDDDDEESDYDMDEDDDHNVGEDGAFDPLSMMEDDDEDEAGNGSDEELNDNYKAPVGTQFGQGMTPRDSAQELEDDFDDYGEDEDFNFGDDPLGYMHYILCDLFGGFLSIVSFKILSLYESNVPSSIFFYINLV